MIEATIQFLERLAMIVPVIPFSFIASLIEEIISPIPSPLVLTTVGSLLSARQDVPWYFFPGVVLAATSGKVLGYWVIYLIADKIEDFLMTRFGRKLGVSHEQIESIGRLFSRTHRDEVFIFIVRFLPVLPSAPISATAGIFKLPLKGYLIASFLGTAMRNSMYLLLGYFGIGVVKDFVDGVERTEVYLQAGMLVFLAGIILWAIRQRTNKDFLQKLLARLMGRKRKETR